jgi:hypothetical protein
LAFNLSCSQATIFIFLIVSELPISKSIKFRLAAHLISVVLATQKRIRF